jgi:hypothetical protein
MFRVEGAKKENNKKQLASTATYFYETSFDFQRATRRNILEV